MTLTDAIPAIPPFAPAPEAGLSDQIRSIIAASGVAPSKLAVIAYGHRSGAFSKFMAGKNSMTLSTVDKLLSGLGLRVEITRVPQHTNIPKPAACAAGTL